MKDKGLPISASIITLNEESNIRDCLMSLDFCQEKVVVDSGSKDRTRQIALDMGANVYERPFEGHWQQKQWALERCANEWVICMDADERVTPGLRDFLYDADLNKSHVNGFEVRRRHVFLGRKMNHSAIYPDYKLRIARREKARWGGLNPHDKLFVSGRTKKIPFEITHYAWIDCSDYIETQFRYSRIMAEEKYRTGKRATLSDLTFRPLYTFIYRYFIRLGILDGFPGFVVSAGGAAACMAKYIFLWERQCGYNRK
ncbi:glycosyltransferase family 2 protein [bacterium]|nr:glycosyltransferase family 2 protein [bacterium]